MNEDKRFYGIYEGICFDVEDPDNEYRIKLIVPQVLGSSITEWARPCMPISSTPTEEEHFATEVAALLNNHSATITSGAASAGTAHTHSVTLNLAHTGNSSSLKHQKVPLISQRVWVMFIAGDPNFPVWIGVQP